MLLRALFTDENSVVKKRFLGFLIWNAVQSTAVLAVVKSLFFSLFAVTGTKTHFYTLLSFLLFHLSLLLFSTVLFVISSPQLLPAATPIDLLVGFFRFVFVSGSPNTPCLSPDFRSRARVSLSSVLFVAASALAGFMFMLSVCWGYDTAIGSVPLRVSIGIVGSKGLTIGLFYGLHYVYKRRWVLQFPIIQRPPFFSFKMGLPSAVGQALKISFAGYLFSVILTNFLSKEFTQISFGKFMSQQIIFFMGSFVLILSWELSHHLYQVLHTKRFVFTSPKGSAAAETNPSEPLLAALEESAPKSLIQYLAYLDLCMVSEHNVDTWRRAAFFEETGETYKRVVSVCLRPLEQFTLKLGECLGSCSGDNNPFLSNQLRSPTDGLSDNQFHDAFRDLQLCAWCAWIASSLTARSHKEDRFGVAQLSGSNASVVSTLISCLLAVETLMGKKTNLHASHHLMGPGGIKWATVSSGKRESAVTTLRKRGPLYLKAYSMADILRTSIYYIVSEFHDEMMKSSKTGVVDKDWVIISKPLYGTREFLIQKLQQFLDFQAC